jgi:FKBP-type peptidyl-prolyl cis-trans isomerase FklB
MASPSDGSQKLAMNAIFPGLREALSLMKIGDKWRLFIPPELAFGANGSPEGRVKPNQTLIYELELLNIIPANQARAEMQKPTIIDDKPTTIQSE